MRATLFPAHEHGKSGVKRQFCGHAGQNGAGEKRETSLRNWAQSVLILTAAYMYETHVAHLGDIIMSNSRYII